MSKRTEDRDALLRNQPDDYVDPSRKRLRPRKRPHKTTPRRTITPRTYEGKPSAPTITRAEAEPYPKHMKLGIMVIAVQDGVPEAAKQFDIPQRTIYKWFKQEGGLNAIREYTQAGAANSFTKLIKRACDELYSRMEDAPDDELYETFRKMLDAAEKVGISGVSTPGGRGKDSGQLPGSPQGPNITLQFNNPPALPPGSNPDTNVPPESPPEDVVEGEVIADVFDE